VGEVELGIKGVLGVSGMLSGTQVINNSRFPLKGQDDFSGVLLGGALVFLPPILCFSGVF
jgi:hypothetical protein